MLLSSQQMADDNQLCSQTPARPRANLDIGPIFTEARLYTQASLYLTLICFLVIDFELGTQRRITSTNQHHSNSVLGHISKANRKKDPVFK